MNPTIAGPAQGTGMNLADVWAAVRRRLRQMMLVFVGILVVFILAAILLPPTYRSTGTILIEQQEIPTDFVRSAVTSYADQRVQVISQRVMTSTNLLGIVDKYKLYPEQRESASREALIDRMRRDIKLNMISAEVMDPRQGRATRATIAFTVSYDNRTPALAARVANELTTLYLSENIETRKQLAADTAGFLGDETARLGKSVAALETKLATFKEANGEKLPEYMSFNLSLADRYRQELRDIDTRMRSLDQQVLYLDAQLVQIDPSGLTYTENGERVMSPRDRLKVLKSQLASARAIYSEDHPTVRRLQRELSGIESQIGSNAADDNNETARRLTAARGELASMREKYGSEHPDVIRLQREVENLQQSLGAAVAAAGPIRSREEGADNPAYIQLRTQRVASVNERTALQAQANQVRGRLTDVEQRQAAAPAVEREYSALERDLQNERAKYAEVRQKQMEAQLVQNLEIERKGERFTLIEPPLQPSTPISPNRPLIMVMGFVLALGASVALAMLLEKLDTRIRDRSHLLRIVGVPALAVVPLIELDEDAHKRSATRKKVVVASFIIAIAVLLLLHFFVLPFDLLIAGLMRRLGI